MPERTCTDRRPGWLAGAGAVDVEDIDRFDTSVAVVPRARARELLDNLI